MRILSVLLAMAVGFAWSQESLPEIRRAQKQVERETKQEKDLAAAEKKRHADFVENTRKKIAALEEQSRLLQAQTDSLKSESLRLQEARVQVVGSRQWVENRRQKYRVDMIKHMDSLAKALQADVPFRRDEAIVTLEENAKLLKQGVLSPEEALDRAFDVLLERIQLGLTTETWSGFLNWQGRTLAGKFVRFGAVSALFASSETQEYYWLKRSSSGYEWMPVGNNAEQRALFKETMKVAEGKAPPALVFLPFVALEVRP